MIDQCRICGCSEGDFLIEKQQRQFKSTWVQCRNCKSAHIDPYPTPQLLNDYYNSGYTEMDMQIDNTDIGVSHKLRYSEGYLSQVFNEYRYSMLDVGLGSKELIERNSRILDFGCAQGIFLDWLLTEGVRPQNLHGYDIAADMIAKAQAKGLNCKTDLKELGKEKIDFVTLWDVIEHVPNPREVVQQVRSFSPQDGVLVQTPHFGELALLMGDAYRHYLPVEHLHLFSRQGLVNLFEREGFTCVAQKSFGANAYDKYVPKLYKAVYDKLAKLHDFGATQVLYFKLKS